MSLNHSYKQVQYFQMEFVIIPNTILVLCILKHAILKIFIHHLSSRRSSSPVHVGKVHVSHSQRPLGLRGESA